MIALQTGRLVKDAFFTLFEAVGALEVFIKSRAGHITVPVGISDD